MKKFRNRFFGALCAAGFLAGGDTSQAATINVPAGELTGTINWTANNEYVLQGFVHVIDGAVLNIEAGTVVRGISGVTPNFGALYICRGGKIMACGTSDRPIIFTSESDNLAMHNDIPLSQAGRALWGGVVLLGKGILNRHDPTSTGGQAPGVPDADFGPATHFWQVYEGLGAADVNSDGKFRYRFGGTDNDDSSGVMRFVSIRHGGIVISPNKEINGLSMAGVGRGTCIENIEVYQQADDGFEWWGGAVNSKYLVAGYCDDDSFDMDEGHIGKHQFWFGIQGIRADDGFELNGQPVGTQTAGLQPFGKHEIYNATLIGFDEPAEANADDVMNTRGTPHSIIRNSVFENFDGADHVFEPVEGPNNTVVEFNHFFNNAEGNGIATANNVRSSNASDPLIVNEDNTQSQLLDPRPAAASPLLVAANAFPTPVDGYLCPAPYKGAFTDKENWLIGWTALSRNQHTKVRGGTIVNVPAGELTGTVNWTADNTYVLQGFVHVIDGAVLNIEPGTIIRGISGVTPNFGALYICRGGKINANGTPSAPIVFTSTSDDLSNPADIPLSQAGRAQWGGVVLLGKGILNRHDPTSTGGQAPGVPDADFGPATHFWQVYEGLGAADVNSDGKFRYRFGGTDNEDNSGVMRYVSIRHGGIVISPNKEINGLSMAAVGRGTVIENVEVYQQADDGFEWWGGAVNSKYLVAGYCDDDSFDMDEGHIGLHQYWFGVQGIRADDGFELNGQPVGTQTAGLQPFGKHEIYNATLIGFDEPAEANADDAINTRGTPHTIIRNSVFENFDGADHVFEPVEGPNNSVVEFNHFFNNLEGNGIATANNVRSSNASDPLIVNENNLQLRLLDPRPLVGSPLFSGWKQVPVNGHFDQTAHKGAFDEDLWIAGWTGLDNNNHLAGGPCEIRCPMPRIQPTIATSGDDVTLTWTALPGLTYQVQVSSDASINATASWANLGSAQRNAGELPAVQNQTQVGGIAGTGTKKYYRVVANR